MSVARELAEFLASISIDDLPDDTVEHAAMVVASTVASAAAGITIPSAQVIRDLARERSGRPDASLWFDAGAKLSVPEVAQANAVASSAAASDDSDLRNIVHAGGLLTAIALAAGERTQADGNGVLAAIVCGYEAAGRIGEAMTPGVQEHGFHGTIGFGRGFHGCVAAVFGATVAAGRLFGLDPEQLTQAIALSATSIGGLMVAAKTSTAREYHDGIAALIALQATCAAARGYVAEESVLEAPQGFFELFGGVPGALGGAVATADLGASWDISTDMAIKLLPGGHPYHAFGRAAAAAVADSGITPEEIESIILSSPGMERIAGPLHPKNLVEMAHSPAYFAAAGAADADFSWIHARADKWQDPVINSLIDKVAAGPEPPVGSPPYRHGGTVTLRTYDGRVATHTVYQAPGSAACGLGWSEVDAKYRALVPTSGVSEERMDISLEMIHDLVRLPAVTALTAMLRVDQRPNSNGRAAMQVP
ncbi:MmgE/PrpD family protein [Conexibacter sp. S30A1]|uniref:MmgE/PrpD family protein n=1 Tax=Conexibacter sp. S30A1 TaxID=2937800 RepID=UPI00200BB2A4|nr:MmgE/PrpD family protein [Conexibacter sp. S30A1]